jgi:HD-GYP domain-containing protein (c-di-GMP phosphodiesterase class II)
MPSSRDEEQSGDARAMHFVGCGSQRHQSPTKAQHVGPALMVPVIVKGGVRLADLLAGLSLISDHELGLSPDDAVRSCLVATALARKLDLHEREVAEVFYDSLFEHVGCLGYAHETYRVWGDDLAANRAAQRTNFADPKELFTTYLPTLLRDVDGWDRPRVAARFVTQGPGFLKRSPRPRAKSPPRRPVGWGLPEDVQLGLRQYAEWWNGKGVPAGIKGEEISLTARVVHVASVATKFDALGGPALAVEAVRQRAGSIFDPAIAATFVSHARELLEVAGLGDPRRRVLDVEPEPLRFVPIARLPDVSAAFGDLVDLKTPFTHGHSAGVARLARGAGERLGLDDETAGSLEIAALLHDLGRVAISNAVWAKPGPLTSGEWEQVRLHPYHSERILSCTAVLEPIAALAGMHHERMDGSGYHRGCSAAQIPFPARVPAAADALQAMTQARPHRHALTVDEAALRLQHDARAGRHDPDAVTAVVSAAGGSAQRSASPRPAALSEREVEVLRLVAEGLSNRAIAQRLFISPRTAEHHVQHIYAKIGASSRASAALFAMEHGLLG